MLDGPGFTGRDYDSAPGLYYYRARYYDASLGTFLSPDPAKFVDGVDSYRYVRNNPIKLVDPTGLCPCNSPCPSGRWQVDSYTGSAAAVIGFQGGAAKITCLDDPAVSRRATVGCVVIGAYVSLALGGTAQLRGVTFNGPCRPEELGIIRTTGWVFDFQIFNLTMDEAFSLQGLGFSIGPSAGVGFLDCMIQPR